MQLLCISIWIDNNPIVWDSSVKFTDNFLCLAQSLTRSLSNKRTQVFWFSFFTLLTHCTFKIAYITDQGKALLLNGLKTSILTTLMMFWRSWYINVDNHALPCYRWYKSIVLTGKVTHNLQQLQQNLP